MQRISAVVPPCNAFGAVLLRRCDAGFKHLEFGAEFLAGNAVRLEDVEQVSRREVQDLVSEILDRTFLVGLQSALGHDCGEHGIILVHNLCGGLVVGNGVGLGGCSGVDVPIEHNIRVVRVVVEVGGLFDTGSTAERVGKAVLSVKPRTEFDDTAFIRREIEIVGAVEGVQHIEVVGQPPIALVGECLRGEIGRVDEETDVGVWTYSAKSSR